jgi:5-methylcytosine-specific restriction enzyme subunit McrC
LRLTAPPLVVEKEAVLDDGMVKAARADEWARLNRLVSLQQIGGQVVVRRRIHLVGAVRFGGRLVVTPSAVPVRTFLGMVQLAYGVSVPTSDVLGLDESRAPELLRAALGASLVKAVELAGKRHIEKVYVTKEESLEIVRGRPLWNRHFGAPPARVVCRYELQTTDSLLNRLLLAGLEAARRLQPHGPLRRRADRQVFTWSGLAARPATVTREDFRRAAARLNRQTEHYKPALALAEALLLGHGAPSDAEVRGYDMPTYNLATMFERIVELLARAAAIDHQVLVKAQHTRSDALIDAEGDVYRRVRPDLVIYRAGKPVAVLDAKFKPLYLTGGPRPPMSSRVVLADAYQLFFYAERLRRLHQLKAPVPAFIVAPALVPDDVPPPGRRSVRWGEAGGSDEIGLRVLAVPLIKVIDALLYGQTTAEAAHAAPELRGAIRSLVSPPEAVA